jgi:3-dehydroquinate dehydratase/shikimate dehydrogenase
MVVAEHRALADRGAELVELRLDWLSRVPDLARLIKDRPTPVVITCRRQQDRGKWRGSEEQRLTLLRTAIVQEVEYVDLEDDIAARVPRYGKTRRVISHHDFEETPRDLEEIHAKLCTLDPDIVKLVTMANSPGDTVRMLQVVAAAKVPTIGFCMGELGQPSRILCGKYGAPFTYATFSKERELAPGQLAFEDMKKIYRYDEINAETKVYGVLGDPIAHSLSPLVHNAAFRHLGLNGVYLPFRVLKGTLARTLEEFEWLGVQGYSVTIPHKEAVLEKATVLDQPAREIGAANTLYRGKSGEWRATNTDYEAALESIRLHLDGDADGESRLRGKRVLVLGAGGAARAIARGLITEGAVVTIAGRTSERAQALAAQLDCQYLAWEKRHAGFVDILVNCTPVGMSPNVDEAPVNTNWLRDGMLVFDTIYNPENTLLLKQARERDCETVSGVEMFVRQAAAQFELFTGREAPLDFMRETFRRGISPVRF